MKAKDAKAVGIERRKGRFAIAYRGERFQVFGGLVLFCHAPRGILRPR